ncbi:MAG: hypothetical protein IID41_17990, partial [Planctomycetes bacterium]|nr:hypothetical protein [Planctomycetota bacterium]
MNRSSVENPTRGAGLRRGLITRLLDLFSNVWLAVVLLVLLFVYSSIGSAYPPFRQHRLLEMTEFEWFHWWPFVLLIGLLALTLCTTTIRRIPLKLVNAGVWMIHSGIIILILGSVYYFGTKVEGDVPVFRRKVVIEVPGAKQAAELVARPGNQITLTGLAGEYKFAIASLQPEWPILSGADAGEKAYSVSVMVTTPRQKFIRQLLAGYPQYTEDIIPGQGRAVKATGKKLLDETLKLTLDYEPQTHFFVQGTSAVYLRPKGSKEWVARPIQGLPRYHERISSGEHLWNWNPAEQRIDPLDLELAVASEQDAFADVDFRVDSYLPYAVERMQWVDGGTAVYPIIGLSVHSQDGHADYELAAFDPRSNTGQGGKIVFHWVESAEQLEPYANPQPARLRVEVPANDIALEFPIADLEPSGTDAPFRKIEGSNYEFRLRNRLDNFATGDGRILSLAIVEIKTPQRTFTRWVADDPRSTRDMSSEGSGTGHEPIEPDTNIVMIYSPAPPPITLVAGPAPMGLQVFLDRGDGTAQRFQPQVGEELTLAQGWILTIKHLHRNARPEFRPSIVPPHRRDRNARRLRSMIHLTLSTADWQESLWLPFNQHAFRDEQYRIAGRTFYTPRDLELPDGRRIELMFSRE